LFWLTLHPLIFSYPKLPCYTPIHPYSENSQTLKILSEKYCRKSPKSRNKVNPDSKWSILKYCIQKPTQIQKTSKESHKENKLPQVPKGNPPIAKNKAIRKGFKSCKRPSTHIKEVIAEITPIQKSSRPRKHNQKPEKIEKMPKNHNIGKTT
jgi:hypothetical protein